ncbi:MAG: hypothetical protein MUF15_28065 [Acidobacteria bacterium]|nr:hypothetical protein [Acidobacteriota bacterium]
MTSYSLYLLKPTSSEIRSQNKPPGKVTKTVSPGPVARNNPENTVIQSKLGIKTAETETAKVSQSTSSKPLNAPVPPNLTNDKNKSNADDNQDNPEIDIIEAAAAALKQPDPVVYSVNRNDLLKCDKTKMETFSIPWIAACAREGTILYKDASLTGKKFQVAFLQQFAVLDKSGDKLKLKELGKPNPVIGWASMKNLIYLPRALKDERTSVYQKIVFTYINDRLEPGEIGDVTFYKSPGSDQPENILKTRSLDNLRYANVYNWEKNDYEDSQWVLIGNYPSIESVAKDKNAFNKTLYGWCKTTKLFPWYSRMALIPNNKYAYIFKDGPALTKFYSKANKTAAPEPGELLAFDSYKMWKDSKWPFFLEGKFNNPNLDYVRLICLVNAGQTNITGIRLRRLLAARRRFVYRGFSGF